MNMTDREESGEGDRAVLERAIYLMREALRLLETARLEDGAAHLLKALDASAAALPGLKQHEEGQHTVSADAVLVRAMGGALSVLTAMLVRKGIASFEEVGKLLGLYAVTTAETSPEEGLILGCWAGIVSDLEEVDSATGSLN